MILDVEFEELNSTFEADFGEVYRITDADVVEANEALDECVHGYVTGAGYAENVGEAVGVIEDVGAAIAEKGVELSDTPDGYSDLIRNEMFVGNGLNPEWTDWRRFNSNGSRQDLYEKIKFSDTSNGTIFEGMNFSNSKIIEPQVFDTSNGTDFSYMFYACVKLVRVPKFDTSKGRLMQYMFALSSGALVEIESLNLSSATNITNIFHNCKKLREIRFEGEIPLSISTASSPTSPATVHSMFTHLKNYAGTEYEGVHTVTLKDGVFAPFEAEYPPPAGYASWTDYIQSIGWNISGG